MTTAPAPAEGRPPIPHRDTWRPLVARHEQPSLPLSLLDVATSIGAYLAMTVVMYLSLDVGWWAPLVLAPLATGFLMRTFIVFHDCAHTSMFRSRRANDWVGRACALPVVTPFTQWRHEHAIHHATAGNLDKRGTGDVTTLTVDEYLALGRGGRLRYRLYRNPLVMFVFGGLWFHLVQQRFVAPDARDRDRRSVQLTNVAVVATIAALVWAFGPLAVLLVHMPVLALAGMVGVWLFYVQHQFEDVYWADSSTWSYADAALQGSSYLRMPAVLQWFTGNIGVHHVHHLSSRIPNYRLQACHDENPVLQAVPTLNLWQAFGTVRFKLWDERSRRLVGWRHLRTAHA